MFLHCKHFSHHLHQNHIIKGVSEAQASRNVKMLRKAEEAIMLYSDIHEHRPVFGGVEIIFMRDTFLAEATNFFLE